MKRKESSQGHTKKTAIRNRKSTSRFQEGEIWFSRLAAYIKFKKVGKDNDYLCPFIILRKLDSGLYLALPLIKKRKTDPLYFSFTYEKGIISTTDLSHIWLLAAGNLEYKSGTISKADFTLLKQKLRELNS